MEKIKNESLGATALIILNYNNYEDTINCIESVEHYNTAKVKIIVVDNGSTRKEAAAKLGQYMEQRYQNNFLHLDDQSLGESTKSNITLPYATYIESATNDGYACGNNKGLNLTECDNEIEYVMILNNDVLFVQDIIPEIRSQYCLLADVAILSPILYKRNMKGLDLNCARLNTSLKTELMNNFFRYVYEALHKQKTYMKRCYLINEEDKLPQLLKIELPSGSCMFIRKALFSSIGFFDPNTFLYYEENILHKKIEKIGMQNYLVSNLKCIHLGAASTSTSTSHFAIMCGLKSGRYYMKNYADLTALEYNLFIFSQIFSWFTFKLQKGIWHLLKRK